MKFLKKKKNKYENRWDKYYPEGLRNIVTPDISIYSALDKSSYSRLDLIAVNYFGVKYTFRELLKKIDLCARSLISSGVRENDVVTICMPNTPEAVIMFFATNKIGAIANLIHPLSSKEEIRESLINTKSVFLQVINLNYKTVKEIVEETNVYKTVVVSAGDSMPKFMSLGYWIMNDSKIDYSSNELFISWNDFLTRGVTYNKNVEKLSNKEKDAIYLHSGGTTGTPKNIVLTNGNINSIVEQAKIIFPDIGEEDNFLSILPIFHCFGLVVCVVAPLILGSTITLIPQFDAGRFDKLIKKYKPTVLTGVPTLYEALMKNPHMINVDISYVKYVISGGDSLSEARNADVNNWLSSHNCKARIIQGYGMTETTGPACFGSFGSDKLGSVGIPLPGNKVRICDVNTREEMNAGEIGEIFLSGPTVMSRYLNNEEETNNILFVDEKGTTWVRTGDLGYMDEDGVLFYVQRLKRMLIVSGYNVYPSHVENTILKHKDVELCGVIGVPHPYKIQIPIAFIVLKKDVIDKQQSIESIKNFCSENLSKYMIPKKFIIKDSLPKTLVGKIDYKKLEKEYNSKN